MARITENALSVIAAVAFPISTMSHGPGHLPPFFPPLLHASTACQISTDIVQEGELTWPNGEARSLFSGISEVRVAPRSWISRPGPIVRTS